MNIFNNIPESLPEELTEVLAQQNDIKIERIVSQGHVSSEWYDQDHDEFVLLVQGEARIKIEEGEEVVRLNPGDYLMIPAHQRHKVEWTLPNKNTIWLAVHFESDGQ